MSSGFFSGVCTTQMRGWRADLRGWELQYPANLRGWEIRYHANMKHEKKILSFFEISEFDHFVSQRQEFQLF